MVRSRRSVGGGGAIASLVVLWIFTGVAVGASPSGAGSSGIARPLATSPPLIYHAALYANDSAPRGTTPSGEIIGALYRVTSPTSPPEGGIAVVRIPSTIVEIPTSSGGVHLYFSALNLTLNGSGSAVGTAGPANRFGSPLQFNASGAALLSTQGIAVAASWPAGSSSILFRWQWVLEAPDGSTTYGPWSNASSVTPAQIADLSFPSGPSWTIGGSNALCVSGPIAGRTFSAHLSTGNPSAVAVTGTVTVPAGQAGPFCWQNAVPSEITPQNGFVHVWEYGNLTYELGVVLVQLVGPSEGGGGTGGSGGGAGWLPVILLGGFAVALVGVYAVMFVLSPGSLRRFVPRRFHRATPGPDPPPGADPSSALAASAEGPPSERIP